MLGLKELDELLEDVYAKLAQELILANRTGQLNDVLKKYDIQQETPEESYIELHRAKILLVGDMPMKLTQIHGVLKEYALTPDHIEYIDYEQAKTFAWPALENSMIYTDVMIGPVPHKVTGINSYGGIISKMEDNPHRFPKLHKLMAGNGLKITKTNLTEAIKNSYLLELTLR